MTNERALIIAATDTIQVYGAGGFIAERTGPNQWRGMPSPTVDAFQGVLRYDALNVGFAGAYSVAQL